jgi:hypothetical protein
MNLIDKCRTFTSAHAAHLFLQDHNYYYNKKDRIYLYFGKDKPLEIVLYLKHLYRIKLSKNRDDNAQNRA